jgi:hypothetical protein
MPVSNIVNYHRHTGAGEVEKGTYQSKSCHSGSKSPSSLAMVETDSPEGQAQSGE